MTHTTWQIYWEYLDENTFIYFVYLKHEKKISKEEKPLYGYLH